MIMHGRRLNKSLQGPNKFRHQTPELPRHLCHHRHERCLASNALAKGWDYGSVERARKSIIDVSETGSKRSRGKAAKISPVLADKRST